MAASWRQANDVIAPGWRSSRDDFSDDLFQNNTNGWR